MEWLIVVALAPVIGWSLGKILYRVKHGDPRNYWDDLKWEPCSVCGRDTIVGVSCKACSAPFTYKL